MRHVLVVAVLLTQEPSGALVSLCILTILRHVLLPPVSARGLNLIIQDASKFRIRGMRSSRCSKSFHDFLIHLRCLIW